MAGFNTADTVAKKQTKIQPSYSLYSRIPYRKGMGERQQTVKKQDENEIHSMLVISAKEKEKKEGKGYQILGDR